MQILCGGASPSSPFLDGYAARPLRATGPSTRQIHVRRHRSHGAAAMTGRTRLDQQHHPRVDHRVGCRGVSNREEPSSSGCASTGSGSGTCGSRRTGRPACWTAICGCPPTGAATSRRRRRRLRWQRGSGALRREGVVGEVERRQPGGDVGETVASRQPSRERSRSPGGGDRRSSRGEPQQHVRWPAQKIALVLAIARDRSRRNRIDWGVAPSTDVSGSGEVGSGRGPEVGDTTSSASTRCADAAACHRCWWVGLTRGQGRPQAARGLGPPREGPAPDMAAGWARFDTTACTTRRPQPG